MTNTPRPALTLNQSGKAKLLRKVPEITVIFWIIKLFTTAMGESTSDYLVFHINPYLAVSIAGLILAVALILQLSVKKYVAWVYWLCVTMVAVFGTMVADGVHIQLGVPYTYSAVFFLIILLVVFTIWKKSEGTLSIHSITTTKREIFYWLTVITTFALGTAAGDWTASTLGFGYLISGIIFIGLILIPALVYLITKRDEVLWFWLAYILTRPLGASFADWFGKSPTAGGLGWGDGAVSITLGVFIVIFVIYLSISKVDTPRQS